MSYLVRLYSPALNDPSADVLAIEQRRSLLERPVLRLDNEQVAEDELEEQPATVENLQRS